MNTDDTESMELCLQITDPELYLELSKYKEGNERSEFAIDAMKAGIAAMKHVQNRLDTDQIRQEGSHLITNMEATLGEYNEKISNEIGTILAGYFDLNNGSFHSKIKQLIGDGEDGELKKAILAQIKGDDSPLADTLTRHVGKDSDLMKFLDPKMKDGLIDQITTETNKILVDQQREIVGEFSLDDDKSALSRLVSIVEGKHNDILEKLGEVVGSKEEATYGTRKGIKFESALFDILSKQSLHAHYEIEQVGNTKGRNKNSKKGDILVTMTGESAAPGARIVIEAKKDESYTMAKAFKELDEARENREAQVGLFVFSKQVASKDIPPFKHVDNNIVIVWDEEDEASDVILDAGFSVAKALCVRAESSNDKNDADFNEIKDRVHRIETEIKNLDQVEKWASTITRDGEKILKSVKDMKRSICEHTSMLDQSIGSIRRAMSKPAG